MCICIYIYISICMYIHIYIYREEERERERERERDRERHLERERERDRNLWTYTEQTPEAQVSEPMMNGMPAKFETPRGLSSIPIAELPCKSDRRDTATITSALMFWTPAQVPDGAAMEGARSSTQLLKDQRALHSAGGGSHRRLPSLPIMTLVVCMAGIRL